MVIGYWAAGTGAWSPNHTEPSNVCGEFQLWWRCSCYSALAIQHQAMSAAGAPHRKQHLYLFSRVAIDHRWSPADLSSYSLAIRSESHATAWRHLENGTYIATVQYGKEVTTDKGWRGIYNG
jgi:hypothetical protein